MRDRSCWKNGLEITFEIQILLESCAVKIHFLQVGILLDCWGGVGNC